VLDCILSLYLITGSKDSGMPCLKIVSMGHHQFLFKGRIL